MIEKEIFDLIKDQIPKGELCGSCIYLHFYSWGEKTTTCRIFKTNLLKKPRLYKCLKCTQCIKYFTEE